jgi:endoglucanase
MNIIRRLFLLITFLCFWLYTSAQSWIRINQLGYTPASIKVAVFLSKDANLPKNFSIYDVLTDKIVYSSKNIRNYGAYGQFQSSLRMDFSDFKSTGSYYIKTLSVTSPVFRIADNVYKGTADFLLNYMRQQQCGYNPFLNDSCHTHDGYIVYHGHSDSTFINVVGGWHDATDYLQYAATSANAVFQMLFAYSQNPSSFSDNYDASGKPGRNGIPDILDEAKWGLDWLLKMNPDSGEMYNQVADDRDHIGFRLPDEDKAGYGKGLERPVYFCTGKPQGILKYKNRASGIASTAGKYASAFALGAMIFQNSNSEFARMLERKAFQAYEFGRANPGACQTAPCTAPYFYEEDNWADDMELAAATLFKLRPSNRLFNDALLYGRQEPITPWMGADTARHYQWYPFLNMGHFMLAENNKADIENEFMLYWKHGIDSVFQKARKNVFLIGIPFIWCSNNLITAMLSQCHLYAKQTGDHSYKEMEAALCDWIFGCNPWGTSMIVGLPSYGITPSDVHSSLSHLKHFKISGGLVDGPVYSSIYNNLKGIYLANGDKFKEVQPGQIVYHDDYADYSTNEPTMDGTADLTYFLSAKQAENMKTSQDHNLVYKGALVRTDTTKKEISLVFTAHEFADGAKIIQKTLHKHKIKATFFFTGDFYRNMRFSKIIPQLKAEGHYLAGHSDHHLLYCDWNKRDSLLISRKQFIEDLKNNYQAMTPSHPQLFLPPYEWYNDTISSWCSQLGLQLVNLSPGTSSSQDWTYPELGNQYLSSDTIYNRILHFEEQKISGLNGFILLTHLGTDPRRTDKFYNQLDKLITELEKRGYKFICLSEVIGENEE